MTATSLRYPTWLILLASAASLVAPPAIAQADDTSAEQPAKSESANDSLSPSIRSLKGGKVEPLFDGKSLDVWRGRDDLWSVEDGCIVGRTTDEAPITQNTFLILNEKVSGDFELTLQFKIEGGNSGIQYHSRVLDEKEFVVSGYQADIDSANRFAGILYEEKGRGILARRGQSVVIGPSGKKQVETFADANALGKGIHPGQWNDYRIVVRGNQLEHFINEALMMKVTDNQSDKASQSGVIALQLHKGPAMKVSFQKITLRQW
ncbi:3-keto-disaccharide hydrolase [Rhodopirellula sallentina]|uniref:Secreted protein containing DUF1080 n=1 Tax=Rhodopirellula sallentina SM41 TaxID=1263870 RepID=M5U5M8_9BACT|nr:DUF1080 domain-containing protein [Rhodopirellula sallentina]EMI53166.1 secreted protein containing DUF1080 [Rhodopirellula sallentina SM41]